MVAADFFQLFELADDGEELADEVAGELLGVGPGFAFDEAHQRDEDLSELPGEPLHHHVDLHVPQGRLKSKIQQKH